MNVLVVYDTQFGNTEQVARAIAARLERVGSTRVVAIPEAAGIDLTGVDLLLVGGPTQAHGPRPALRAWVDALSAADLEGRAIATFDTRFRWPVFLSGSAARSIGRAFERKGARLVVTPESFFVTGSEGPLAEGEIERAGAWAAAVADLVASGVAAAR